MTKPVYWHGTRDNTLTAGQQLLPMSQWNPNAATQRRATFVSLYGQELYQPDRVYVTTDREYARAWVARRRGSLLRVDPHGPIEEDPDTGDSNGFAVSSAEILAVVERPVSMPQIDARKALAASDLTRYDANGYLRPGGAFLTDLVDLGITAADCRPFGPWANPHRIIYNPATGSFEYEADDVALHIQFLAQALLKQGMSEREVTAQINDPAVVARIRAHAKAEPNPWL